MIRVRGTRTNDCGSPYIPAATRAQRASSPLADVVWPDDATRDRFVADWHLYQRRGGHRTSADDLVTAWLAVDTWSERWGDRPVATYGDLGCGVGSVLLMVAQALRPERSIGIEAQAQSALLAARTLDELPDPPDITLFHGDLRDASPSDLGTFQLLTGSPPYLPVGTGVVSPDPQRAACRFELRGGVEAYCDAAARLLDSDGLFVLVFQTRWSDRVIVAATNAKLKLHAQVDFRTRAGDVDPFLTVFAFQRSDAELSAHPNARRAITIRGADGEPTAEYLAIRRLLGAT